MLQSGLYPAVCTLGRMSENGPSLLSDLPAAQVRGEALGLLFPTGNIDLYLSVHISVVP